MASQLLGQPLLDTVDTEQAQEKAQPVQKQETDDKWTKEEWAQWTEQENKKKKKPQYTWSQIFKYYMQNQWFQCAVFVVLGSLLQTSALANSVKTRQFQPVGEAVWNSVVALCAAQFIHTAVLTKQFFRRALKNLFQLETTNQVLATRANMDEWRQCLTFASKWHKTSLQGAYKLWQSQRLTVPAPPANQWLILKRGMPMSVLDQSIADEQLTSHVLKLMCIDSHLTTVHEKQLLVDNDILKFDEEDQSLVDQATSFYTRLQSLCSTTKLDFNEHAVELLQFISEADAAFNWKHNIFQ